MSNSGFNTALIEPIILAIDTSSNEARLSVYASESVIATLNIRNHLPHSQTLFAQIHTLLELAYIEVEQISAFAVGTGPGSFTGLRVGLAAVKGLADSLNKPCLGVDSLDLHALASGMDGGHLVMLSAGRGEAYCGFREVASDDIADRPISDRVDDPLSILRGLRGMTDYPRTSPLIVVGDCGYKYKDEISGKAIFLKTDLNISSVLARRAALLLKENRTAPATPHYIRQSDAEIEWRRRQ
jgi:tRNA threonylcarbamoyl adenosine modification protein YeaZ